MQVQGSSGGSLARRGPWRNLGILCSRGCGQCTRSIHLIIKSQREESEFETRKSGVRTVSSEDERKDSPGSGTGELICVEGGGEKEKCYENTGSGNRGWIAVIFKHAGGGLDAAHSVGVVWR